MRFIDFLHQQASWSAQYKECVLNAQAVAAVLSELEKSELASVDKKKLHVFCTFTPIQTLMAYFVASHFGLMVAIVSPRGLQKLLDGLEPALLGPMIIPNGHQSPNRFWSGEVLKIDLEISTPCFGNINLNSSTESARFIFCTSGTTGKAKRVIHNEQTLIANAKVVANYLQLERDDHTYCVFPLQFMYGLSSTLCTLWSDSHISYGEFVMPSLVASYVQQHQVTVLPLLGDWSTELKDTWQINQFDSKRLILINASDRLINQQAADLLPWASQFWNNLGQTESAPRLFAVELVARNNLEAMTFKGTIAAGYPVDPAIKCRLKNVENGIGSLWYHTPYAMEGYLQDDGSIIQPSSWINSGDLFYQGSDHLWYWVGRNSHTIKVNGELVPLNSVTNQLLMQKGVSGVGYVTNKKGDLCAFVESQSQCENFRSMLTNMMTETLRGKRSQVRFINKLPRTENGKVDFSLLHLNQTDSVVAQALQTTH